MLSERFEKLSPWLCSPFDRSSRAYLETHLDLLTGESDRFLELFIHEHEDTRDEQRRLRMIRHLLRDAEMRGKTVQAVREAYINMLGGLILDPPAWLQEIELEWGRFSEPDWTDRRMTVCKLRLKEAVEQASAETVPEITAELQYELGNFFANDVARRSRGMLEQAVGYYTSALQVYTAERYPLRCALLLLTLGDMYRRLAANRHADLIMQSLSYYSQAMAIYEPYGLL
ncbi:MAG TPA: hypothetical protein VGD98_03490 [Ktedonobacteraceae bacterium]